MTRTNFGTVAIGSILLLASCQTKTKPVDVWVPQPLVHWSHLSNETVVAPHNGYEIVAPRPTRGLFPATVAVTRIAMERLPSNDQSAAEGLRARIFKDPRNEFLYWNSAFDDQMAVSEVFPVDQFALGGGDADPELVIASFRALRARLGLIYAVNELSEQHAEILGALYDTHSRKPIAFIHAEAASVAPVEDDPSIKNNLWNTDAKAIVRARFEQFVYGCMRELIGNDEPGPVEAPTGWTPVPPVQPVQWPPRATQVRK